MRQQQQQEKCGTRGKMGLKRSSSSSSSRGMVRLLVRVQRGLSLGRHGA
jgi:hypothetical protein